MKLKIPEGLEKSERNEKLSPTIGQPRLPGMPSIALGERVWYNKNNTDNTNTERISESSKLITSIFTYSHHQIAVVGDNQRKCSYIYMYIYTISYSY